MMNSIIKKNFTLLELMVVFFLLTFCFSLVGINVKKALYSHGFQNNIKTIDSYFEFCKKMALSNQADIYVSLKQENENLLLEMGTDEKMGFFKNQKQTKELLKNLHFYLNDEKSKKLQIVFSSTNKIQPEGKLEFKDTKEKFSKIKNL